MNRNDGPSRRAAKRAAKGENRIKFRSREKEKGSVEKFFSFRGEWIFQKMRNERRRGDDLCQKNNIAFF